jgi:hypothetical protein
VRDLVQRHGGSVGYDPDGNAFVVRLPGGPAQAAGSPATSSATRST